MSNPLKQPFDRWQAATLAKSTAKMPEQPERTVTASGRPVDTLYWPQNLTDPAACPEGWTCIDNPNGVCWASSDGTSGCTTDGPEKICAPPYYDQVQALAGQSKGEDWTLGGPFEESASGTDGAGSEVDSPDGSNAAQPDDDGSTRGSSSGGGCSIAQHGSAGGAWLLSLLALAGLFACGAVVARVTARSWWYSGLRQLLLGGAAAGVTYVLGTWIGAAIG